MQLQYLYITGIARDDHTCLATVGNHAENSRRTCNAGLMSHLFQLTNSLPVNTLDSFNLTLQACVCNAPQHRGGNINTASGPFMCVLADTRRHLPGEAGHPSQKRRRADGLVALFQGASLTHTPDMHLNRLQLLTADATQTTSCTLPTSMQLLPGCKKSRFSKP